jgi:L-threonylcarbamoyladenylate synthase
MTRTLGTSTADILAAAALLQAGGLVALPTETVYGLGADATNDRAVAGIFAAKGRPQFNPLIVHVPDLDAAAEYADVTQIARVLAAAFWPGPLTLVMPVRDGTLSPLVTAGLPTVAIRVPAGAAAQELLRKFGGPIAAPSANPSGRVSPTTAAHVLDGLAGKIDAVIDAGPCAVGVESTIIGCWDVARMLRPGGVPAEAIEDILGVPLAAAPDNDAPTAPGQLQSHYAPGLPVQLNITTPTEGALYLGFGACDRAAFNLSPTGDLTEAAANLFHALRLLDGMEGTEIAVAPIPEVGLGRAINDRLRRAAAPRG